MIKAFFSALSFYTRFPVPRRYSFDQDSLTKGTVFLPLIGLIVGSIGAASWYLASLIFPHSVSVILSMAATILFTGAFHEDGFTDSCDGLGGGWTKEQKLEIMKDSRVGAFGLIGTNLILLLKFFLLFSLPGQYIVKALISAHIFSRLTPVFLIYFLKYVGQENKSKAKPVSRHKSIPTLIMASFSVMISLFLLNINYLWLFILFPFLFLFHYLFLRQQLGGYTGDLLGASQQISEISAYAGIYIICGFIV